MQLRKLCKKCNDYFYNENDKESIVENGECTSCKKGWPIISKEKPLVHAK
jgi:hypothetical protein